MAFLEKFGFVSINGCDTELRYSRVPSWHPMRLRKAHSGASWFCQLLTLAGGLSVRPAVVVAVLCAALCLPATSEGESGRAEATTELVQTLLDQGVSPGQILGSGPNGIPLVCGTTKRPIRPSGAESPVLPDILPPGTRGWECIPGVIRDDGVETFWLEVDANGDVARVTLQDVCSCLIPPEAPPFDLHDDGLAGDRVAGDSVFTAGPFRHRPSGMGDVFYWNDSGSPFGLTTAAVGTVIIEELDGTTTRFLRKPEIGTLRSDIPDTLVMPLSPDIGISPHLINVRSDARETQRTMRLLDGNVRILTNRIYEILPDAIDFFMFFSANKVELLPRTSWQNFVAGLHAQVQTNFTGGASPLFDQTALYGSNGVLLGVNKLDAYTRGVVSKIAMHEIIHEWSSFTSTSLGLSDGSGHYKATSSAASLVGGFQWIDRGDGTFTLNCNEGQNGAHHAPPIDRYIMGLIEGAAVAPLHVNDDITFSTDCGGPVDSMLKITIEDIQNVHGIRTPAPAEAQRDFRIAFAIESHRRLLNRTEMTYYEILAAHYAKPIPAEDPDPYVGFNWVPIGRFFGTETTWSTVIPVFYDSDLDGDVDLDDFTSLINCLSGPTSSVQKACRIFDRDGDRDADLIDFAKFQVAFTALKS